MMDEGKNLAGRIRDIQDRILAVCDRAGRPADSVQLIAVSKTRTPDEIEAAARCGLECFGENRVQEAALKIPLCGSRLRWHLIGHLQGNKVRPAVRLFEMIHSIDSLPLLQRVDAMSAEEGRRMPVLLEVNVSGEASKFGLQPDAVSQVIRSAAGLGRVEVRGLMTVPPASEETQRVRGYFRALRELRDRMRAETGLDLPELSMGMSGDFETAIEEGATLVRIGTDLFGPRPARMVPDAETGL
jgi:hypothetical protein